MQMGHRFTHRAEDPLWALTWQTHIPPQSGEGRMTAQEAALPDGHTDFVRLLADGCDAAVAHAGPLVVAGGRPHVTKLAELRKLDSTIVVGDHHVIINWGKREIQWRIIQPPGSLPKNS